MDPHRYPTAHEVMSTPVDFRVSVLITIEEWKNNFLKVYRESNTDTKLNLLSALLIRLSKIYEKPVSVEYGRQYCYMPHKKTIILDEKHASIISSLHEFAHHIYGSSELDACRWSIWLFKKSFPKTWSSLRFEEIPQGLLLVKKTPRKSLRMASKQ